MATVSKGDRAVYVLPRVRKRLFHVQHKLRTTYLSSLRTTELAEVTEAAATWLGGATARELAAAWPFADLVDIADAYESGDRIEFWWQAKLHHMHTSWMDDLGPFIEAAMQEPRLRRIFPFTSMY